MLLRSTTSARPLFASPGRPVSEAGIASPTTTRFCSVCASAVQGGEATAAASQMLPRKMDDLAKGVHRDRLEPGLRIVRFALTDFARRIDRARDIAVDLGELAVLRLIDPRQ